MRTLTISRVDPSTTPEAELGPLLAALHASRVASGPVDKPHEPPETLGGFRAQVLAPWSGNPVRLLFAGWSDEPEGHAIVELPVVDNRHLGRVELHVDASCRRRGVGRSLLAVAVE